LIEGVASSFLGFFTWMILPDWPSTTKWLSEEEQILAAQRLAYDGLASTQGAHGKTGHWDACKQCFSDWKVWIMVVMASPRSSTFAPTDSQYMLCTGAQTIQYFVPTLVGARKSSGHDRSQLTRQSAGLATLDNTTPSRCTLVPLSSS
jgi:hypothetical protein